MRDCSCRGSSGFAHLSCIIKNAESEAKRYVERADGEFYTAAQFAKAFEFCPLVREKNTFFCHYTHIIFTFI